ncbi:MAG: hypothetical protein KDM64_19785, partial [Verrucomicrobiae bacterium]|nr:hypothetical protein [Verrucomicrobiae bacterium]
IDTIGGLVFNEMGQVPSPGSTVTIDELRITVRRTQRQRILAVEVERLSRPEEGADSDTAPGKEGTEP